MIKLKKLKGISQGELDGEQVSMLMEEIAFYSNGYVTYGLKKNYKENKKNYQLEVKVDFGLFKIYPFILYASKRKPLLKNIRIISLLCLPITLLFFLTLPLAILVGVYLQGYHDKKKNIISGYNRFYRVMNLILAFGLGILVNYLMIKLFVK